jgi:hypothetical protein
MKNIICLSLLIVLCANVVQAQNENILTNSVQKELDRSFKELSVTEYPPHFISYQVIEKISHRISAKFGKIVDNSNKHTRQLDVDLRVGTPKLDNTHQIRGHVDFGGGITSTSIPIEDDELSIRNSIWSATDRCYKRSIEKFEKAKANDEIKVAAEDTSADFSIEKPNHYKEPLKRIIYYNEMTRIYIDPEMAIALDTIK